MDKYEQEMNSLLGGVTLPQGAGRPAIQRISLSQFPVVTMAITGANGDLAVLRQVAQERYVPALSAVQGVSRVEVTGGADDALLITLDPAKMNDARITMQQVAGVLQANNLSIPGGAVQSGGQTLPVRVGNSLASLDEIKNLVVGVKTAVQLSAGGGQTPSQSAAPTQPPTPVRLGDIADIQVGPAGAPGISRTNGSPSINLAIYMNQGANTVETSHGVREALERVKGELDPGQGVVATIATDQAPYIEDSIADLQGEALRGALFAIVVIFGFLLSVRSTLVTAISIPTSILITFIVLWQQGITLNIMTLGGLAVAVGRVVDDSIVVLESIYRHVQKGEEPRTATLEGTKEVALAITASTLTTVAVFLPLAFVSGLIGEIFRPFALSVTFALLASLLVALTIVPVLASYLIRKDKIRPAKQGDTALQRVYAPVVSRALRHPIITLVIAFVLLVGSLGLAPFIGTSFLNSGAEKIATVTLDLPVGASQQATAEQAAKVEEAIKRVAPTELIQTEIGGSGLFAVFNGSTNSRATITARFPEDTDMKTVVPRLREQLPAATGQGSTITVSEQQGGAGGGNAVSVVVKGADYAAVSKVADDLTTRIARVQDVVNVSNNVVDAKPEIQIDVDPTKALALGSTTAQIGGQVRDALSGIGAGTVTIDNQALPVRLALKGAGTDIEALKQLPVGTTQQAPLGTVAEVRQGTGPVQVIRVDGDRSATVSGTISSDTTGTATAEIARIIREYPAPSGVTIEQGGVAQQQGDAFKSMGIAMLIAIALVYLVMVVSFGSLATPFVILFTLPLAVIGVMVALFVTGKALGLPALIGVLMLIGIVVTNAIVLLEYVIELRHRGLSVDQALIEGGKVRVRPILMTALATILALIPLAFSGGGAIIAADLAVVVIGGLLTSTLLTLVIVPVIYKLIARRGERRGGGVPGDQEQAEETAPIAASPLVERELIGAVE
jgi:HAE1 family hydrophobic/amphiphilic exporter-1